MQTLQKNKSTTWVENQAQGQGVKLVEQRGLGVTEGRGGGL